MDQGIDKQLAIPDDMRYESQNVRTRRSFWWREQQHPRTLFIRASYRSCHTTSYSVSTRSYNRRDQNVKLLVYTKSVNKVPNHTNTRYIQFTSTLSVNSFEIRDINRLVEPDRSLFS